jgi:tetratricopeptide (TPR) repeat protein
MAESGLKRLWNAIKPPPPVPRRPSEQSPARSKSFWEFLKPPPAAGPPKNERSPEERNRRKRLLVGTAAAILIGGGAWGVYAYVASAPQRAEAVLQEGMRLMASGKNPEAVARFTKATDIWPPLAAGYLERGLAHLNLHETDAAVKDFQEAIDVNSNLTEAHTALGSIYRQRGDLKGAVKEFTLAIKLGSDVEANYQRGQMYESLGEHQKALEDYSQAIGGMPDAPYVYRARAMTRENLGDEAGAKEDRQKALLIEHPYARRPAQ